MSVALEVSLRHQSPDSRRQSWSGLSLHIAKPEPTAQMHPSPRRWPTQATPHICRARVSTDFRAGPGLRSRAAAAASGRRPWLAPPAAAREVRRQPEPRGARRGRAGGLDRQP